MLSVSNDAIFNGSTNSAGASSRFVQMDGKNNVGGINNIGDIPRKLMIRGSPATKRL